MWLTQIGNVWDVWVYFHIHCFTQSYNVECIFVTTPDVHFAVLAQHWTNYKIGVLRWKVTQSHTKVALGPPNSSKMSTTDYRQPSHLNEFRVHRDEDSETHAIPPGSPAERPVHININSYLRKIWRFATSTIATQDSWGNPAIAAHSTTIHQRKSNSSELV